MRAGSSTRSRSIASLAFFVLALFVAVPKDRARRMIWKHGRQAARAGAGDDGGVQ